MHASPMYTHADLVCDVWTLLDHLGIQQSYVFGSSFGATIALAALREKPRACRAAFCRERWHGGRCDPWRDGSPDSHAICPGHCAMPYRNKILDQSASAGFRWSARAGLEHPLWNAPAKRRSGALGHQAMLLDRTDVRSWLAEVKQPLLWSVAIAIHSWARHKPRR